jgi:hypothetical protein
MRGRKRTADDADVAGGRREDGDDSGARARRSDGVGAAEPRAVDAEEDVLKVRCTRGRVWFFIESGRAFSNE